MEAHVGKLTVTRRDGTGKTVTRKLRQQGLIPAVLYGEGGKAESLTVDPAHLVAALDPVKKGNTLIELTIESPEGGAAEQQKVMVKEHQIDAIKRDLLHADFIRVAVDKPVRADVPLHLEGRAIGVQMGGLLNQVFRVVPVECTPDRIPAGMTVDVTDLNIGDTVQVSNLSLPDGVTACLPADQTLALVVAGRGAAEEEGEEEQQAEGQEAASAADEAKDGKEPASS